MMPTIRIHPTRPKPMMTTLTALMMLTTQGTPAIDVIARGVAMGMGGVAIAGPMALEMAAEIAVATGDMAAGRPTRR